MKHSQAYHFHFKSGNEVRARCVGGSDCEPVALPAKGQVAKKPTRVLNGATDFWKHKN